MKIALVFQADKKFLPGLKCLIKSLELFNGLSKFDKILISDDLNEFQDFKIKKVNYEIYKDIDYSKLGKKKERFKKTFYKLECFNLEKYDRVVFLDADILCMGDIDLLFSETLNAKHFWAAKDKGIKDALLYKDNHIRVNTGVMIINKSLLNKDTFLKLIDIAKKKLSYDGSDQGVINEYIFQEKVDIGHLPTEYNALKRIYVHDRALYENIKDDIKLLHFVGKKPWEENDKDYEGLENIWWRVNNK